MCSLRFWGEVIITEGPSADGDEDPGARAFYPSARTWPS